jgi:hypothetical protein
MNFNISDDAIKRTLKCPSNYRCLNGDKIPMCADETPICRGERYIGKDTLFIKPDNTLQCNYLIHFSLDNYVCTCPVRTEIFSRYNQ